MFVLSILTGILSFIMILVIHIIIWRVKKPKKEIMFLLILFIFLPFLFLNFLFIINHIKIFTNNNFLLSAFLLYLALSLAYIQTYPAARANAPSLQIVYFIYKSACKGLSEYEILDKFNAENLIYERIEDLSNEDFIYEKDKKLFLTFKGKILADIFCIYRKLYSLEFGEG